MEILEYLDCGNGSKELFPENSLVHKHLTFLNKHTVLSSLKHDVALLGIPDNEKDLTFEVATIVRQKFYELVPFTGSLNVIDLGNIKTGHTFNDTCFAIREVVAWANQLNIIVVLLGGNSAYNLGSFLAFEKSGLPVNMVHIDSITNREKIPVHRASDLDLVDRDEASPLFNYINIGYQSYYVDSKFIDFINNSYYEAYRLGYVRANIRDMEPVLRDANFFSFSLNSVKYSDAPGAAISSPNGFTGEEVCQLSFYAGHSNRMKCFGIFDLNLANDNQLITAKLGSQIVWYFLEALSNSIYEEPDITPENFKKFLIHLNNTGQNIAFFKSNLTNRWWMEINYPDKNRNLLLSCSESDYELACQQEIPDRWLRTFHRISH